MALLPETNCQIKQPCWSMGHHGCLKTQIKKAAECVENPLSGLEWYPPAIVANRSIISSGFASLVG